MSLLRVAAAPMRSAPGDVEANLADALRLVDEAACAGANLLVLPEACLTGYRSQRPAELAVDSDCEACASLEEAARRRGIAASYGFIERNPDGPPFVANVVTDGARRLVYRKTNLGEKERGAFSPGNELPVERIAGVAVGVHLCWESHLAHLAEKLRANGAELLLVP